jgi:hypothetical protein
MYDVEIYGGFGVQPDYDFGTDNPLAGGRFQITPNKNLRFGFSGLFSKLDDETHYEILGVDFDVKLHDNWLFSGNVDYDLSFETLSDMGLFVKYTPRKELNFQVNYEVYYPMSYLGPDSIFSIFSLSSVNDLYCVVNTYPTVNTRLYGEVHYIEFETDSTQEAIVGCNYMYDADAGNYAGINALFQWGDYRYAHRITGILRHRLNDVAVVNLRANAHFLDNENQLFLITRKERYTISSLFGALDLHLMDSLTVTPALEVAGTIWDNRDVRGYVKLTYTFNTIE